MANPVPVPIRKSKIEKSSSLFLREIILSAKIIASMSHATILVADDCPEHVAAIKIVFHSAGVSNPVQTVTNSEDAIMFLNGEGPYSYRKFHPVLALLLLDVKLPDRSGFDVLEWLLLNPKLRPRTVVALADPASTQDIRAAFDLGINACLLKPVKVMDLLEVLRPLPDIEFAPRQKTQHRAESWMEQGPPPIWGEG